MAAATTAEECRRRQPTVSELRATYKTRITGSFTDLSTCTRKYNLSKWNPVDFSTVIHDSLPFGIRAIK